MKIDSLKEIPDNRTAQTWLLDEQTQEYLICNAGGKLFAFAAGEIAEVRPHKHIS
ncbi:MAG: hypothetical protein PF495_04275 [Spirochaetales bacterium]|jgi:hypothetical protein|nr:hypothetical protein [Spirochaetales bacterium]